MININNKSETKSAATSFGTKVTDEKGNMLPGITDATIRIKPGDLIRAELNIFVSSIDLDCQENKIFKDGEGNRYKSLEDYRSLEDKLHRLKAIKQHGGGLKT